MTLSPPLPTSGARDESLHSRHDRPPHHRRRAGQPDRGRHRRQRRRRARELIERATDAGADLAVFSELFLIGYPPEDLALKPAAVRDCRARAGAAGGGDRRRLRGAGRPLPWPGDDGRPRNAVALIADGEVKGVAFKIDLPNYGVFDEKRVFAPGAGARACSSSRACRIGVPVCEDIWGPSPCAALKARGAEILLVPNGSPYRRTADDERLAVARARVARDRPAAGLRQPGRRPGRTGVRRRLLRPAGATASACMRLPMFEEALGAVRLGARRAAAGAASRRPTADWPEPPEEFYRAMVLGLRDYVRKSRLHGRAARPVRRRRFGHQPGRGAPTRWAPSGCAPVMLPSRYTSRESLEDADDCAAALRRAAATRSRSRRRSTPSTPCSAASFAGRRPTPPRRTSRRASAA